MTKLLRKALEGVLQGEQARAIETGIDIIGDIAIVKLADSVKEQGSVIGESILRTSKNVRAVFDQEGGLEGDFRLRRLRHLAGEERTLTTHKENGLRLVVDVEKCYFSPRLSTERMRIAEVTQEGDKVLNMFAGVGPYSVIMAKRKRVEVWSCELNEVAYKLHLENNRINKVEPLMHMYNRDASKLTESVGVKFDRILMPHPSQSDRYLRLARGMLKKEGWIHYYRHLSGRDAAEAQERLAEELRDKLGESVTFTSKKMREIGPHYVELVADIHLTR